MTRPLFEQNSSLAKRNRPFFGIHDNMIPILKALGSAFDIHKGGKPVLPGHNRPMGKGRAYLSNKAVYN